MLFKSGDIKSGAKKESLLIADTSGDGERLYSSSSLSASVADMQEGQTIHYVSRGQWSMHELLEMVLSRTGPADVFLTTWTITEDPARALAMLKSNGLIRNLSCILDYRIKDRKPAPFQLLEQTADRLRLTQCHAKTTVAIGEHLAMLCLSSANYSRNPRIESGVICLDRDIADFHRQWIEDTINEAD